MNSATKLHELRANALKIAFGAIAFLLFFELVAIIFGTPHLPAILRGIQEMWSQGKLPHDIAVSSARWLTGWTIGSFVGIVLGLITGRIKRASLALEGLLTLFRAIPFISLVPLVTLIFGLSETGKISLIAWASAGTCWIVAHQTSKDLNAQMLWRSISLGIPPGRWVTKVLLPECAGGMYTACRTALSLSLIVVAIAELGGVYERSSGHWWSEGLGYRLFRSLDSSKDDFLLGTIFTFAALGVLGDGAFAGAWWLSKFVVKRVQRKRALTAINSVRHVTGQEFKWAAPQELKVADLEASYGKRIIIKGLELGVPAGQTLSVVGPSGCGKTTMMKALGGFRDPNFSVAGRILLGGIELDLTGCAVGLVLQDAPVFSHLTVWENITVGRNAGGERGTREAWEILREFGLDSLAVERAEVLSGGQRQRLALATALANKPKLLLLDEPFGALDAITRRQLQHFYWRHVHGKVTAIFVTHDLEESLLIADMVRIGITVASQTINANKENYSPDEWETKPDFNELRAELLTIIKGARQI